MSLRIQDNADFLAGAGRAAVPADEHELAGTDEANACHRDVRLLQAQVLTTAASLKELETRYAPLNGHPLWLAVPGRLSRHHYRRHP